MIVNRRTFPILHRIRRTDNRVFSGITALYCRFMDRLMVMATYAGTGAFLWFVGLAAPFLLSDTFRKVGIILTTALGVNYLIGEIIIKKSVGRSRPSVLLPEDEMKIKKPRDHSFPSGHSASSFCAFAVTLICCPPAVWIPALAAASVIGFSRIYLRVHWLSDVIGGLVLGLIDGTATALVMKNLVLPAIFG